MQAPIKNIFSGSSSPWHVCLVIISQINPIQLQVLISSKKTHNFFLKYFCPFSLYNLNFLSSFSSNFFAFVIILSTFFPSNSFSSNKNLTISSSVIPAWILRISILLSPLLINSDNFLISDVLPQPVSPIIITGIFSLIRSSIKTILIKLSAVKTYSPTISSIDFNPSFAFLSLSSLSLVKTGFFISNMLWISWRKSWCLYWVNCFKLWGTFSILSVTPAFW